MLFRSSLAARADAGQKLIVTDLLMRHGGGHPLDETVPVAIPKRASIRSSTSAISGSNPYTRCQRRQRRKPWIVLPLGPVKLPADRPWNGPRADTRFPEKVCPFGPVPE